MLVKAAYSLRPSFLICKVRVRMVAPISQSCCEGGHTYGGFVP